MVVVAWNILKGPNVAGMFWQSDCNSFPACFMRFIKGETAMAAMMLTILCVSLLITTFVGSTSDLFRVVWYLIFSSKHCTYSFVIEPYKHEV